MRSADYDMTDDPSQELPCSEKIAFDTQQEAQAAATTTHWHYGLELYAYKCRYCNLWHLSSQ